MADDGSPSTLRPAPEVNRGTALLPAPIWRPTRSISAMVQAYGRARDEALKHVPVAPGYRLFWAGDRVTGWLDLSAERSLAVLGRHTECDVVLADPPELSLRHLVAMTVRLSDGLGLRLLDLHTSVPFFGFDDTPRVNLVALGPIAIRLAHWVVGAIPLIEDPAAAGGLCADSQDLEVCEVEERDGLPEGGAEPSSASLAPLPDVASEDECDSAPYASHITSLPPSARLGALPAQRLGQFDFGGANGVGRRAPSAPSGEVVAQLSLRRADRLARVELTAGELELGVLVGRSDRSIDAGLQSLLDTNISRPHLLLLRQQGHSEAFDLCSTQGTYLHGRRIRHCELEDTGTTLELARGHPLALDWSAHEPGGASNRPRSESR